VDVRTYNELITILIIGSWSTCNQV